MDNSVTLNAKIVQLIYMPELPEVETVRKYLENNILNWKIKDIVLSSKKSLRNSKESDLKNLVNQSITKIDRFAKHLIIRFNKQYIICHLRMEGKFYVFKDENEMNELTKRSHDILMFKTNKGIILFQDTRRFATVDLFDNSIEYGVNEILVKVGPEVFDKKWEDLFETLSKKRTSIKTTLLDQSIISGLGNIYVDEVLFRCKIHPETLTNQITKEQAKDIIKYSIIILNKAIELKGTTIRSYTSSLGVEGSYQNFLNVHQRKDLPCKTCKTKIIKLKVGGRGTYICPKCQKK